jgi:FHA domain
MIPQYLRALFASGVLVLSLWTPGTGAPAHQAPGGSAQQAPAEDEERRKKVSELMLKAYAGKDLRLQRALLIEVLGIDSAHIGATQLLGEVDRKIADEEKASREAREKAEGTRKALEAARGTYVAALAARSRAGLKAALSSVDKLLEADRENAEAGLLKARIEQDLRAYTVRLVLVIGLALVLLIGVILLVLWVRRRPVTLLVLDGPQEGECWPIAKELTVLGAKESEVDCLLLDASNRLSRRHCEILRARGRHFLIDTSSNGTAVNTRRVPKGEPVRLKRGDTISLSDAVHIRFG